MTTTTTLFSTLSLWLFMSITVANLSFSSTTTSQWANQTIHQPRCFPSEKEALLEFKKHLKDPSNWLATWDSAADHDCCSWYGVSCHHHLIDSTTQYVAGLHLGSLSFEFGSKVSSALLSLKHLRYLDLSYNDFGGMSIPSFLGSMRNLRYLNLSNARFGGMIPHQLGNLSNLQYLNLRNRGYYTYDTNVKNLQWMSGLSSLKFLDLSGSDLSKVLNWDKVIVTTLPSLLQLYLSDCQLPSPQSHLLRNNISASSISILDLSLNYIGERSATFLSWVSRLKTLNYLNMDGNDFHGSIPRELQNMSSLQEVYLDYNNFNSSIPNWLYGSHTTLKVLSLYFNQLSSFQPQTSSVKNFSSLSVLDLSYNNFQGPIPVEIQNMTSLHKLDLSSNEFSSHIPDWLDGFTRLEHLNLDDMGGNISSTNWNMPSLISLFMSGPWGNKLELDGGIPKSFKNYCNLRVLDLQNVKLRQDINQVLGTLSLPGCVSNGLQVLGMDDCQLFGNLVTTNHQFGRFMSLMSLKLGFNNLTGTFPLGLGRLERLEKLYLHGNSLAGDVSEAHFENLTNLLVFDASWNHLKLRVSPNWIPPFNQLNYLNLESWHIGPQFPAWLRSLENLYTLHLSSSGISSTIPVWFWNFSSTFNNLILSCNQLHGVLPSTLPQSLDLIDMSSNHFHGPLPLVSPNLSVLDLSNNAFSGSISKFLCPPPDFNSSGVPQNLKHLNLRQNDLHGEIPNCLAAWPKLEVVILSDNKFNGTIPESIGTLLSLHSLHLGNNSLSGKLPSLKECTELATVDVGENELSGNISSLTSAESLSGIKILILRSNKFNGPIPDKLCHGGFLYILDLANNLFHGTIPSCLGNLSAMAKTNESTQYISFRGSTSTYGIETASLQTKGNMLKYSRNLGFVRSLDFSNNKLGGKIPDEITSLHGLVFLNLSHNALSGGIPKHIGLMQELNSMDLSANQLSGEIPQSISNLTSLGKLNLSYNRLSGRIPSGNQIQTFDASSFAGNQLCGNPLPNKCSNDIVPHDANDEGGDDGGDGMMWFYVSMAFGFVGGFWCFVGPLLLNKCWRFAYSQFLDRMWDRIWWKLHMFGMC